MFHFFRVVYANTCNARAKQGIPNFVTAGFNIAGTQVFVLIDQHYKVYEVKFTIM